FDAPDRVANLDAAPAVHDRTDQIEGLADMLHGPLVQKRPLALQWITAQIAQGEQQRQERQKAEPDQLPLPADLEAESDEPGRGRGQAEPHEEDAWRRDLEHEQDRRDDHPIPRSEQTTNSAPHPRRVPT